MVAEYNFEKDYIVKYFMDVLKYDQVEPSVFNSELMLIPHIVRDFIYTNNQQECKEIIKKEFAGDIDKFFETLLIEVSLFMTNNHNVAIQLNPKKHISFKFLGKYLLNLYIPFDSAVQDKNIYTVMQQPIFVIKTISGKFVIKPDVGVFLNGFFISFIQLKLQHRNQNARDNGRGQIIGDYLESVKRGVTDFIKTNETYYNTSNHKELLIQSNLKYFHSPIHMVTMDTSSAYIIRDIAKHYNDAEKLYLSGKSDDSNLKSQIQKQFFIDSVYTKEANLLLTDKCKKVLYNLYSKDKIQNEILYYNFLGYEKISEHKNGKKGYKNKNNTAILSYPRPNQKFGVDKTIAEVIKKYQNENNPNYEIERLEKRLTDLNVSDEVKARALEKRKSYKNNKNQYSILLQYAAGFGKTYILCWLALMMKDLKEQQLKQSNSGYLFDKIFLVSDRVDLRDQVDRAMQNMNIEKSLFAEAETSEMLKKYLNDVSPRIIIVNIQKFPFLKDLLEDKDKSLFKDKRVAFLIDEIHRSNAGKQHEMMSNLFDEVANATGPVSSAKKNLIIGLTATPTDENLARFGEYQGCLEDIKWMPFDYYTMNEAIADGFVLNPVNSKVACSIEILLKEEEGKNLPSTQMYYEFDDRLRAIAKKTAEILVTTTFRKIGGYGKGMLACYSITAARKYHEYIKEELAILTSNPKYANFAGAKVYVVYTSTQEDISAHELCEMSSEKEVISSFKSDKNGIMIVVDKLQTGFDEPRLHTLFLDKEINGINAVQTICRVNRTAKNKEDCLVIDYSLDNVNMKNIDEAFAKYANIVVSELDSFSIKARVEEEYKKILVTEYYLRFFNEYKKNKTDINLAIRMQQYIDVLFTNDHGKMVAVSYGELYLDYIQKLGLIDNIIGMEEKYKKDLFISFLRDFINIVKDHLKGGKDKNKEVIDFWFESIGVIEPNQFVIEENKKKTMLDAKLLKPDGTPEDYNILTLIREKNQKEENKEILMAEYQNKLLLLFERFVEYDRIKNNGRLLVKVLDPYNYTQEEINKDFQTTFNGVTRRFKIDDDMYKFITDIKENFSLIESDFQIYLGKINEKSKF